MNPVFLHAANPGPMTGDGNWTYLIGARHPVLIDAGVGTPSHLDAIDAQSAGGPAMVIVTHGHRDHVSGAPAIHERWPAARFAKYPWAERDPAVPWSALHDGQIVPTDEGDLQVLHTPGHSPDHVTLWHAASRTMFTGDLLVLGSTVVIPASHGGSLAQYLSSLERLRALKPARALPAHGVVIDDPLALIDRYVRHRAEREAQILAALSEGFDTVERIAARIYPAVGPALLPMARESVLAHLQKLEHEGRAQRANLQWSSTGLR